MKLENKTLKIVFVGVLAALIAVLSQIQFPLPSGIPVTLQTFAVALCGYVLGVKLAPLSVLVYLALGLVGVPVFAGFGAGPGVFLGMTGGYLWGFLFLAFLCGLGMQTGKRIAAFALGAAGLALCHLCGCIQFALVLKVSPLQAFMTASLPYLIKDLVSILLAELAAEAVLLSLRKTGLVK